MSIEHVIDNAYRKARIWAEEETGIDQQQFPAFAPMSSTSCWMNSFCQVMQNDL